MPKYKLCIPSPGEYIYCEGDMVYVGDTAKEAHEFYVEEACEEGPEFWVTPEILRGRCVYARDIDGGDCHEDAEPGDTTFDYVAREEAAPEILRGRCVYARDIDGGDCHEDAEPGDTTFDYVAREEAALRPLKPGEILTWPRGTWRPFWTYGLTRIEKQWERVLFMGKVGTDMLGEDFPTREAAQEAVEREVVKRVDGWKAAHPQYRCVVPGEEPRPHSSSTAAGEGER